MSDLRKEGERIPPFILVTTGNRHFHYGQLLRRQRIVLVILGENPGPEDKGRQWLREARKAVDAFEEREMTVLVLAPHPDDIPEAQHLPEPFITLRDPDQKTIAGLGGAPAFYLIGKDTGIKRASRNYPQLNDLFQQVDKMPMRQEEMRRKNR